VSLKIELRDKNERSKLCGAYRPAFCMAKIRNNVESRANCTTARVNPWLR